MVVWFDGCARIAELREHAPPSNHKTIKPFLEIPKEPLEQTGLELKNDFVKTFSNFSLSQKGHRNLDFRRCWRYGEPAPDEVIG